MALGLMWRPEALMGLALRLALLQEVLEGLGALVQATVGPQLLLLEQLLLVVLVLLELLGGHHGVGLAAVVHLDAEVGLL